MLLNRERNSGFLSSVLLEIKRDWLSYCTILIVAIVAGWFLLLPGYFNMHDDLQVMRQLVIDDCLRDLQIPCRWTNHMGYGFGFPLFNYYPQLPYLFGEIIHKLGFAYIDTVKLTFLASFIFSGITMYIFAKEFWGKLGGFLSSVFYIWAPYHSVDIYVRGAMNEAWALIWFPLVLWSSYKLIVNRSFRYIIILALGWTALLNSHNLMAMIFGPLFAVWALFWVIKTKKWEKIISLGVSGVWALGLSAFFTLPVFFEQKYVHVETLVEGYYEYIAHFVPLNQLLISRHWGYGPSVWLQQIPDGLSFQVGHLHWILSIIVLILLATRYIKTRKFDDQFFIITLFFLAGWFAVFMIHNQSTPVWLTFHSFLKFVQFPWRFLTLAILCFSFLSGSLVLFLGFGKGFLKFLIVMVLALGIIIWNKPFFAPEHGRNGPLTDQEKLSGVAWDMQQTAGIYDYLPLGATTAPKAPQKILAEIQNGEGNLTDMYQISNFASFKANITSQNAYTQVNIFEYPGWKIFIDGKQVRDEVGKDEWGRMHITIPQGEHLVEVKLYNTPVRTAGNTLSLISWATLFAFPLWGKRKFVKNLG